MRSRSPGSAWSQILSTLALAALALGLGVPDAAAQGRPAPKERVYLENLLAARVNPLGLVDELSIGYRHRLYRTDNPLLQQNFAHIGAHVVLSPAFGSIGPQVVIQPVSILSLSARYSFVGYFGTFKQVTGYPSAAVDFGDSARGGTDSSGYATLGSQANIALLLQGKFGPAALRNKTSATYWNLDLNPGERTFYDQYLDLLHADEGWSIVNDLDVMYLSDFGFIFGARYTVAKAFHEPDVGPGAQAVHRVGPLVAYRFHEDEYSSFSQPTLILLTQWFVEHPYRTGQRVTQALPYIALAFSFNADLWNSWKK